MGYAEATGDMEYKRKAEASYRGVLSLFKSDGSASAAYVYPVSVNGVGAGFDDPYCHV